VILVACAPSPAGHRGNQPRARLSPPARHPRWADPRPAAGLSCCGPVLLRPTRPPRYRSLSRVTLSV